eukprot:gnl/TRDRNA2_/TRDRNA2_174431_c2_seq3.p1 gnl/TRDRNA2_/TRDRNA2_174431_c2~~gnl/TRDRNA2_/TRDRNA2_174431_c2_seq3.p1  ORF type:complete len:277 (+),score=22.32 gnl/TRDRNA2_/TRDRNA2_174431_c2_seq3:1-831(+)
MATSETSTSEDVNCKLDKVVVRKGIMAKPGFLTSSVGGVGKRYASIVRDETGSMQASIAASARHDPSEPLQEEATPIQARLLPGGSWGKEHGLKSRLVPISEDMDEQASSTVLRSKIGGIGKRYASIVHDSTGNRSHAIMASARHDPSQPLMFEGHKPEFEPLRATSGQGCQTQYAYPASWAPSRFSRSFGTMMYSAHLAHSRKVKAQQNVLLQSSSAQRFGVASQASSSTGFVDAKSRTLPALKGPGKSPMHGSSKVMSRSCPEFFSKTDCRNIE